MANCARRFDMSVVRALVNNLYNGVGGAGHVRDMGTVIVVFVILAFAVGIVKARIMATINEQWPPLPFHDRQAQALAESAPALQRIGTATVLVRLEDRSLQRWLEAALADAVHRANESQAGKAEIQITSPRFSFEKDAVRIQADYAVRFIEQGIKVSGTVDGLGFVSIDQTDILIRPYISELCVTDIEGGSDLRYLAKPIAAIATQSLRLFIDNINGALDTYHQPFPVKPLGTPGNPAKPIPINFPDPYKSGNTTQISFTPPTLSSKALLLDRGSLYALAELKLDPQPPSPPPVAATPEYAEYVALFQQKIAESGLATQADNIFAISPSFLELLIQRYVIPSFSRDRVGAAIADSLRGLDGVNGPDVGVVLSTQFVRGIADAAVVDAISKAKLPDGVKIEAAPLEVRPQHFYASAKASAEIAAIGAHIEAETAVVMPIAGSPTGVVIYPAIDKLAITKLEVKDARDLSGIVAGIDGVLGALVGAVNGLLPPHPVGIDPVAIDPVDLAKSVAGTPGMSVSPAKWQPPQMQFANFAFLLDTEHIAAMGDWRAPSTLPPPSPIPPSFEEYRDRFEAKWRSIFPSLDAGPYAKAYIRTRSVAGYLMDAWNSANVTFAYNNGFSGESVTPVMVDEAPNWSCKQPLDCPSCGDLDLPCRALKAACELANGTITNTCNLAGQIVPGAINAFLNAIGRRLGDMKVTYDADVHAALASGKLTVSDDFSAISLSTTGSGNASTVANFHLNANSFSGRLVCPADFWWRFPVGNGRYGIDIPQQPLALPTTMTSQMVDHGDGRNELHFTLTPTADVDVHGHADHPPLDEAIAALGAVRIECPVLGLIPGIDAVLGLIGMTAAANHSFPDIIRSGVAVINDPTVKAIFTGDIDQKIKIGPIDIPVLMPGIDVMGRKLKVDAEVSNGLIKADAVATH